jgi:HEAT repeat protein
METAWGKLEHAYGPADDIPELLRAMESEDADVREEASHELFSALCHQGTVYDASAHAVPHLARLALHGPGHRRELLWLIGGIADGDGKPAERAIARRAVAEALPSLLHLAHDPDPEIRDAMVLLIACLGHPYALPLLPLLRARLDAEPDAKVREHQVTALGLLEAGDGGWRHGLLTDPEPRVRLAAAEDLLRTAEPPLPAALVDVCARAYAADPHDRYTGYWPRPYRPFTDRLLEDDAEAALRALAHGVPLAHEITERWRDREADVLPWALGELAGQAWELYRLARLTCALPAEAHPCVRERVLPYLDADDPDVRAAALTVLARAGAAEVVPEVARLVEEAPGLDGTVRAVTAVAEVFGAAAQDVARAVTGRLDAAAPRLVALLARYPEVAAKAVADLAALVPARTGPYPAVTVLGALGPAAGAVGAEALRAAATGDTASSLSMAAALAYHGVTGDPGPALALVDARRAEAASGWPAPAGELGPAAAPLLPYVERRLAKARTVTGRGVAALAVWRITGRTEDTVAPLARWLVGNGSWTASELPDALPALTAIGLLPRFAVEPLRKVAESARRVGHDLFVEGGPHPDYVLRSAVRELLATARVID